MRARHRGTSTLVLLSALAAVATTAGVPSLASGAPSLPPTECTAGSLVTGSIASIAGTGASGTSGDGGPALTADIDVTVGGLAVAPDGAIYFTGYISDAVRRIDPDGSITTVASTDGGAPFVRPDGLAFGGDGSLFITDPEANRIWRLDRSGVITSVAGTGERGSAGDGERATDARLTPFHVEVTPDGSLLLDDLGRYRRIDATGIIHALAGTDQVGFSGDGGPAIEARTGGPATWSQADANVEGAAVAPDGTIYFADTGNQRIRRIDPTGIITTIAGTGERGYSGDGGPALEATFADPVDLALDEDGNLYVSDHHNDAIRRIDTAGIITTIAGKVLPGRAARCGPATQARLQPWAIDVHDGVLYIADMAGQRIEVVLLPGT